MFKNFLLLAATITIFPAVALAAGTGFVPATGLWFSKTSFAPNELVTIYTVVINSDYPGLTGTVGFYDNDKLIDTVAVPKIAKDEARQIKVAWMPEEGSHTVSARFTAVYAVDASGKQTPPDPEKLTITAGAPLVVNNTAVVPETALGQSTVATVPNNHASTSSNAVATASTQPGIALGATSVTIIKTNGELVMAGAPTKSTPAPQANPGSSGQTIAGSVASFSQTLQSVNELFQKNREALGQAEHFVNTVTTTGSKVAAAYDQTKAVINQGQQYYQQGQGYWEKIQPYAAPLWSAVVAIWYTLSNNNEPKRILIIAGVVIVLYILLKFRRARYREFYDR